MERRHGNTSRLSRDQDRTERYTEAEKAGGSSKKEMAQKNSTRKQRTGPSRQARLRHPPGTTQTGNGTTTELPAAREKQQQPQPKGNRESKSTPRSAAGQKLRRRTSPNDACADRSWAGNRNSAAAAAVRRGKELITADEKRRLTEIVMEEAREADLLIQQLNELGVGEDISDEELQCYYQQLPREPPRVDTFLELDDEEEIKRLQARHALFRVKYYKVTRQGRKDDAELDDEYYVRRLQEKLKCFVEHETELEGDHILERLDEEGLLWYIEKDDTFDWSFQYRTVAALDDYQRLVPQNGGGCEYVHWDDYREYFHKYEIELEYLDFWEELSKKLKWMEEYIHFGWPTLKWGRICSRGESQAIKIATGFSNITVKLAHAAYYECIDSINMEFCWYKELDGVYFEIWKRVAKLKMSFGEALYEVYKLDMFPLRQHVMKYALESDGLEFQREFDNCTEDITEEVTEEKAQDLIADAITKLRTRPKFYAQYIRKKIEIARAIGIIPRVPP